MSRGRPTLTDNSLAISASSQCHDLAKPLFDSLRPLALIGLKIAIQDTEARTDRPYRADRSSKVPPINTVDIAARFGKGLRSS